MSFTPEELAEMARADAEIEREFILTAEEAAESRELDRAAKMERKDKKAKAVAEYQRRYREANKEALAEYQRRYREANKEAKRDKNRQYYQANKEAIKAKHRQHYQANKEAIKAKHRQHYQANREALTEYQRRYYEANKGRFRGYYAKQKAKKAAALLQQDSGQPEGPATNTSQV